MMYRFAPGTTLDSTPTSPATDLKEDQEALGRWEGEGGSPWDHFGVLGHLERQREAMAEADEQARRARATWRGWINASGRLVPPPRVGQGNVRFEDHTAPVDRTFGFYLIKVPAWEYTQVIRASHPTALRVAQSRTQYGAAELHFLGAIDTPAMD